MLPAVQRQLEYLTTTKTRSPSAGLPQLQPILSRSRSLQQPNKQPIHCAGSGPTAQAVTRPSSPSRQYTNNPRPMTVYQQEKGTGHKQGCENTEHTLETAQLQQHSEPEIKQSSDSQVGMSGSAIADSDSKAHFRRGHRHKKTSDVKSPKRNLSSESSSRRQSSRNQSDRTG